MPAIAYQLLVQWDGTSWTDETSYLASAGGSFKFVPIGTFFATNQGAVDTATISLANVAGRYNNRIAPDYAFQRHVRLSANTGAGLVRIFSGAISSLTIEAPNAATAGTLQLECTTEEGPYLQRKFSSTRASLRALHNSGANEVDWINYLLDSISSPLTRTFDPGFVNIPWLWVDDESVLDEVWGVCAAAGGVFYVSRMGALVYNNISTIAKRITVTSETLSRTAGAYSGVNIEASQDDLYSDITVEASPRLVGSPEIVWTPDNEENMIIPPDDEVKIIAKYDSAVWQITQIEFEATSANGDPLTTTYVNLTAHIEYAAKSEFTFTNTHPSKIAYIKYIRVHGYPLIGGPVLERETKLPNDDTFWYPRNRRDRSIRDNPYIQTGAQAKFVADVLLEDSAYPRAVLQLRGLQGKTDRFIGDTVVIHDPTILAEDIVGQIEMLTWRIGMTYEHDIVVRDYGRSYDLAPYFIVGDDTACSDRPIFY